jgi:hypothetical protein
MESHIKNFQHISNNIKMNKINGESNYNNHKELVYELIDTIYTIYPKIHSKKFVYKILEASRDKIINHKKKLNIKEFLYYMNMYNIIPQFSEDSIQYYSDGIIYDHIFLLEDKPRCIILLFLYFGLIKDDNYYCHLEKNNYLLDLNFVINELI